MIGVSRDIEFDLRNDLFAHLEGLAIRYYQRNRTGDIMARATNDLNAVRMLLGPAIMYSANTIVFTAGALAFMLSISPKLTLFTFLPLPVVSIVIQYFGRRIHERFERIQAMFSDISARAQENFSGARVIRAYVQEEAEIEAFERENKEYIRRSLKLVRLMGMLWPTLELMLGLRCGARAVARRTGGAHGTIDVDPRHESGRDISWNHHHPEARRLDERRPLRFLQHLHDAAHLADHCAGMGHQHFPARHSVADAHQRDHAGEAGDHRDAAGCAGSARFEGEIEFRNLTFGYDGKPVLHDVNLRIPAGSSLAIVGPTGSGKTTLVNLIPRIYDADPGMVLIDGRPIRDYSLESLRRSIGFVPQETFLFSDRIRENIALGVDSASDLRFTMPPTRPISRSISKSFPEGYETLVGERGITLSGGQKQRTAIARALIRNPRILILDDALSSVDTHTEDKILNHLRDVMPGRTTIFISHRVSTVRNADRIAVLHGGRIVELGTHDELLALNGYYTDLYNKQLLEEELAEV